MKWKDVNEVESVSTVCDGGMWVGEAQSVAT